MTDAKSTKLDISDTTTDKTIQKMMTEMTVVIKALNDLRDHLKDTEDVGIDREGKVDEAQIKRDQFVEEKR